MQRAVFYSLMLLGFSTLLIQCVATQQDVEYTNVKVRKMDSKVDNINKEIDELKKKTVEDVRSRHAETSDRLDYQQSEILRLQGEIEESNFFVRQIQEENKELKKLLAARIDTSEQKRSAEITKLNERLALTEEQLLKAEERITFAENEITSIKNARSQEAAQKALEAAQRAREAEKKARAQSERKRHVIREISPDTYKINVSNRGITQPSEDEKEAEEVEPQPEVQKPTPPPPPAKEVSGPYEKGMDLFRQKKYRDAYNSFAEYLDNNPSGPQAVDARYHAAESLYQDKDYELAILEFQKVIVEHPRHTLAPKALYRQGLAFEKIGDPDTARIVFNKLVDTYPKSGEVASAKTRLEALKQ
ncbi:MAG: tol-pal system protein YbgF [Desulfobulbales bacterium]|nr:tol-pal system protein YbgF [Desulfobulbales bacterium]